MECQKSGMATDDALAMHAILQKLLKAMILMRKLLKLGSDLESQMNGMRLGGWSTDICMLTSMYGSIEFV